MVIDITVKLYKAIKNQQVAFFVGAGISTDPPSYIYSSKDVMRYIISSLCKDEIKKYKNALIEGVRERKMQMEPFFQLIYNQIGDIALKPLSILDANKFHSFDGGKPNLYHLFLAETIKKGFCKTILTTNFDTLIEDALNEKGLKKNRDFRVIYNERDFQDAKRIKIPTIFKLHGCVSDPSSLIALLQQVGRGLSKEKITILEEAIKNYYVCFIGWSNNDFDITPHLKTKGKEFFWIKHLDKDLPEAILEFLRIHGDNSLKQSYKLVYLLHKELFPDIPVPEYEGPDNSSTIEREMLSEIEKWTLNIELIDKSMIIGKMLHIVGLWDDAIKCYKDTLTSMTNNLMPDKQIKIHNELGTLWWYKGELEKSSKAFNVALSLADKLNDIEAEITGLNNLGLLAHTKGEWDTALSYYQEGIELSKSHKSYQIEGELHGNLGDLYRDMGEFEKAAKCYQRDIYLSKKSGDIHRASISMDALGEIYRETGKLDEALKYLRESLKTKERIGDTLGVSISLMNIGNVYYDRSNYEMARKYYEQSRDLKIEIGDMKGLGQVFGNLSNIHHQFARIEIETAVDLLKDAEEQFEKIGDKNSIAMVRGNLALLYRDSGELAKAIEILKENLKLFEGLGSNYELGRTHNSIGRVYLFKGDYDQAISSFKKAYRVFTDIGDKLSLAKTTFNMGETYEAMGQILEAKEKYSESLALYEKLGLETDIKDCIEALTRLNHVNDNYP